MKKRTQALPDVSTGQSSKEMEGISLGLQTVWVVKGVNDPAKFFPALLEIAPKDSILYMEGTSISRPIQFVLNEIQVEPIIQVQGGTTWPRPKIFHVPFNQNSVERLVPVVENCNGFDVCDHLHLYRNNRMLLQWFDAWDDPIGLSVDCSEAQVKRFCEMAGGTFKRFDPNEF